MTDIQLAITNTRDIPGRGSSLVSSLQTGQVLPARVLDVASSGQLTLGIAGQRVLASANTMVAKGAVLTLQVIGLEPVPNLKIIGPSAQAPVPPNPLTSQVQMLLPRQGNVTAPFVALRDSLQSVNFSSLPGVQASIILKLDKMLQKLETLSNPRSLEQAVLKSGFFLESRLARLPGGRAGAAPEDIKATLLQLQHQVQGVLSKSGDEAPSPQQRKALMILENDLRGALATITLNQLAAREARQGRDFWRFDIPFVYEDTVLALSVGLAREDARKPGEGEQEESDWKILLNLSLPALGLVEAELVVRDARVSGVIWAQQEQTVSRLEVDLPRLKDALVSRGLEVSVLLCRKGDCDGIDGFDRWRKCVDERA